MNWAARIRKAIFFVIVLSLGLVLIASGIAGSFGPSTKPSDIHLSYVTGKLSQAPEINSYRRHAVYLHLVGHPQLVFGMSGAGYDAAKIPVLRNEITAGDTVIIGISADDSAKVHAAGGTVYIAVYTLRTPTLIISTPEGYAKATNSDSWIGVIVMLMAGIFVVSAFSVFWRRKR